MNKTEIQTIKDYLRKWDEINQKINEMQNSIENLAKQRDQLISSADLLRERENMFFKELQQKYGESAITPATIMEIIK